MKKIQLLSIIFLLAAAISLMSNAGGRATKGNEDATGSPLSNRTCAAAGCHSSNSFSVNLNLVVKDPDGNSVEKYKPGITYDVTLTNIASGSPSGYGFQMVSLLSDNTGINEWTTLDNLSQTATIGSRTYVEHTSVNPSNTVNLKWTAPMEGSGDVTFYAVGNAVNGNGNTSGDGVGTTSFSITEDLTSSINETRINSFNISPNPATDFIRINAAYFSIANYSIINVQGQTMLSGTLENQTKTIDVSHLNTGLYIINLLDVATKNNLTQRLIIE